MPKRFLQLLRSVTFVDFEVLKGLYNNTSQKSRFLRSIGLLLLKIHHF